MRAITRFEQMTQRPATFSIANHSIGNGPAFVIAEVGVNHNGDPELAHRLVDAVADAGADAVKFQTFVPELLAAPSAGRAEYQKRNTGETTSQLDMLRALVLPQEAHQALKEHAHKRGILFLSTPFDSQSAAFLHSIGVPAWKVSSGDLTNHPFLAELAAYGLPMLVSTGMATLDEVRDAVAAIDAVDPTLPLALFHCVSDYPTAPADCNLAAMATMRDTFSVPVGWSDHTEGVAVSIAAAGMGAQVFEKHITLDRGLPGPDHAASLQPDEFRQMVQGIRIAESARGNGTKAPLPYELTTAALARKSIVSIRDIEAGELLTDANIAVRRPGTGLPPASWAGTLGRKAARAIAAGQPLTTDDLQRGEP